MKGCTTRHGRSDGDVPAELHTRLPHRTEPDRIVPAHLRHADPLERRLHLLVASGGDERIWHDPATGRTRYATTVTPAAGKKDAFPPTAANHMNASWDPAA